MTLADIQRAVGVVADGVWGPQTAKAIAMAIDMPLPKSGTEMESLNKLRLYNAMRGVTGRLSVVQVASIEAIINRMSGMPIQHIAYVLATAWHEARFKPQREWGRGFGRPYGRKGKYGFAPYGRGLVQLTWDRNYEWADKRLGLNGALLRDFDLALHPTHAADILVYGMLEGAFASNGKPLSHYGPRPDGGFDYRSARQTVNVMDKADLIAGYAKQFESALREGGWS